MADIEIFGENYPTIRGYKTIARSTYTKRELKRLARSGEMRYFEMDSGYIYLEPENFNVRALVFERNGRRWELLEEVKRKILKDETFVPKEEAKKLLDGIDDGELTDLAQISRKMRTLEEHL